MTNAFSSMGYPHWLMVAGCVLLVLGFIGVALRQTVTEPETAQVANGDKPWLSESEVEVAQAQAASRQAELAERAKERWAKADNEPRSEEPLNDRPKVFYNEPK